MSGVTLSAPWPTLGAVAALALVIGLILLVKRIALHKISRSRGRIALAETIALDRNRRLHLVRCDDRFLLLTTGGPQDLALGWLPERADSVADRAPASAPVAFSRAS